MTTFESGNNKFFIAGITVIATLVFVALSQPAWNSKHLIRQTTDDCKQRHGVLIVDHGMFGDNYSCQSYLGGASHD